MTAKKPTVGEVMPIRGRLFEIIDYHGKLAMFISGDFDDKVPVRHVTLRVSKVPVSEWPTVVGQVPNSNGSDSGRGWVYVHGKMTYLDAYGSNVAGTAWEQIIVDEDCPKPRNGRSYGWKWDTYYLGGGRWQRQEFPRCDTCRRWHNPEWPYCDTCGRCHLGRCKP